MRSLILAFLPLLALADPVIRDDGRCGSEFGGAVCAEGQCCSKFGHCGISDAHCLTSEGCQSGCHGSAPTPAPAPALTGPKGVRDDGRCGKQFGNAPCPWGSCCSKDGHCGTEASHCLHKNGCQRQCKPIMSFEPKRVCNWAHHKKQADGQNRVLRCKKPGQIAFAFTHGPSPATPALVSELERLSMPGFFFFFGDKIKANQAGAQSVVKAGMEYGIHGWNNAIWHKKNYCQNSKSVWQASHWSRKVLKSTPRFFSYARGLGFSKALNLGARDRGKIHIRGTMMLQHWNFWQSQAVLLDEYEKYMGCANKDIDSFVVMNRDHGNVVKTMEKMKAIAEKKGFKVVSMSECMGRGKAMVPVKPKKVQEKEQKKQ